MRVRLNHVHPTILLGISLMAISTTVLLIVLTASSPSRADLPNTASVNDIDAAILEHLSLLDSRLQTLHTHLAALQNATQYLETSFAASTGSHALPPDFKFPRLHEGDRGTASTSTVMKRILGVLMCPLWFGGFGTAVEGLKAHARDLSRHKTLTRTVMAAAFFAYCGFVVLLMACEVVFGHGRWGMQWWMLVLNGLWGFYAAFLGMVAFVDWEGANLTFASDSPGQEYELVMEQDLEETRVQGTRSPSESDASGLPKYEKVAPSGSSSAAAAVAFSE